MGVVSDVLETRVDLVGLGAYTSGLNRMGGALDLFGSKAAIGFGIAAVAITGLARATLEAGQEQADFNRAVGNFKGAFPLAEMESFAAELQDLTGVADDSIASFLGVIGTFQLTQEQAKSLALPILNASESLKALGINTASLANMVGKAIQKGVATPLTRAGIILDETAFKAASTEERVRMVMDALQAQGGDAAIAFRKTLPGAIQAFDSALADARESLGKMTTGPFKDLVETGIKAVKMFTALPNPVKQLGLLLGTVLIGKMILSGFQTLKTAGATVQLAHAHLQAASAANVHATAQGRLNGAMAQQPLGGGAPMVGGGGRFGGLKRIGGQAAMAGGFLALSAMQGGGTDDPHAYRKSSDFWTGAGGALGNVGSKALAGGMMLGPVGAAGGAAWGAIEEIAAGPLFNKSGGKAGTGEKKSPEQLEAEKQTSLLEEQNELLRTQVRQNESATGGVLAKSEEMLALGLARAL